ARFTQDSDSRFYFVEKGAVQRSVVAARRIGDAAGRVVARGRSATPKILGVAGPIGDRLPDQGRADGLAVAFDQAAVGLRRKQRLRASCNDARINEAARHEQRESDYETGTKLI